ncbi:MAG: hypothetical protein QNJ47_00770 [Nostocaceae cyanobacterium]|nr:hypothetical protein [Nostocaceae cyanobacterium]
MINPVSLRLLQLVQDVRNTTSLGEEKKNMTALKPGCSNDFGDFQ